MYKLLTVAFLLWSAPSFSQNFEKQLFNSVSKELVKQNEFYRMRKNARAVKIYTEPIDEKKTILYSDTMDSKFLKEFKKYNFNEQLQIIEGQLIPILPLNDTVSIIDSINFFIDDLSVATEGHIIQLIRCRGKNCFPQKISNCCLYLYAVGIQQNELILSFTFNNDQRIFFNCYFDLSDEAVKSTKSKIIDYRYKSKVE